ncbi:MAG: hypothetical protein ACOY0R_03105 [Chloroflexota bacterium]
MSQTHTKGEAHGCIVCGRLYQMYVVYDEQGRVVDSKVMSDGGRKVEHPLRVLVACESHAEAAVEAAVVRVYGEQKEDED